MTATMPYPQQPQAPQMPVCGVQNLTKIYGVGSESPVVAVQDVTLAISRGSFTAIMGPSGSGKSTLMHCMAGLDKATNGNVFIGPDNLSMMSERDVTRVRRDRVGFIFQAFNLLPTLTAEQNIILPLELAKRPVDRQWFTHVVNWLGIGDRLKHRPSELSGGQQQRVAIARALITRPEVVFADEPTGALDSRSGLALLQFLQHSSREQGQTIIMVTHDPNAAAFADRAVVMLDGRIIEDVAQPTAQRMLGIMGGLGA